MKCDETQPECRRCITARFVCRGYKDIFVPSNAAVERSQVIPSQATPILAPSWPLPVAPSDDGGAELFEFYRHELGSRLGGALEFEFWERLVLQLGRTEPAIHHGLAALSATFQLVNFSRSYQSGTRVHLLRESSLKYYNAALLATQQRTEADDSELVALVTCLLFLCIEFVHGNVPRSLDLLPHGLGILRRYLHRSEEARSSSEASIIRQTITPVYERLIVLSALFGQKLAPLQTHFIEALKPVQGDFAALLSLRDDLYHIATEAVKLAKSAESWRKGQNFDEVHLNELAVEKDNLLETAQIWLSALWKCLNAFDELPSREEQLKRTLLMWHACVMSRLQSALERSHSCFETHLTHFSSIVENAERLQEATGYTTSETELSFEMGSLPPLYHVATKCRFPIVRARALTLMRRSPRREGLWDRDELIAIATRVAELEDCGSTDEQSGSAPVVARVYGISIHQERPSNFVKATFSRPAKEQDIAREAWDELIPIRNEKP